MMLIWEGAERWYWGGDSGRQCMKWWVGSMVGRVLQLCSRVKARERGCRVTSQGFPCAVIMGDWFRGGGSEELLPPIQCRISVIAWHIQLSAEVWRRREFCLYASLSFFLILFFLLFLAFIPIFTCAVISPTVLLAGALPPLPLAFWLV